MGKAAKVYYLSQKYPSVGASSQLYPAPMITINPELIYANDTVIGYTYTVSITGYATSIDKRNIQPGVVYGFKEVMESINSIKDKLSANGGILLANTDSGELLFKCIGGTIRNINFEETDSKWVNYAQYSVEIEFNEIIFGSCDSEPNFTICQDIPEGIEYSPLLLDMQKYKVKSFTDNFTIEIPESTTNNLTNTINVRYSLSATGKHYFNEQFKLMPAWEQAKNFVQYKILDQIKSKLNSRTIFQSVSAACSTVGDQQDLYDGSSSSLLSTFSSLKIYNETLSFTPSESEGSFSAEYSAIMKLDDGKKYIHTYTKNQSSSRNGNKEDVNISINGVIQGLIDTGIVSGGPDDLYEIPASGSFVAHKVPNTSKYTNASLGLSEIFVDDSLNPSLASSLGLTYKELGLRQAENPCLSNENATPKSDSINYVHDYNQGSITYDISYSTEGACKLLNESNNPESSGFDWTNIQISIDDSVDIIAEFVVPGRSAGPIIQKIGAKTPKKLSINIEGASRDLVGGGNGCCPPSGSGALTEKFGGCELDMSSLPSGVKVALAYEPAGMKLTSDQFTVNSTDGSYSISKSFTEWCC